MRTQHLSLHFIECKICENVDVSKNGIFISPFRVIVVLKKDMFQQLVDYMNDDTLLYISN